MILLERGAGDPARIAHAIAIVRPSTLDEVAAALEAYADSGGTTTYLEQVGDGHRWSPATDGGPYALLRVLARFLRCEHTQLTIGYQTVDERWCVIGDPEQPASGAYVIQP